MRAQRIQVSGFQRNQGTRKAHRRRVMQCEYQVLFVYLFLFFFTKTAVLTEQRPLQLSSVKIILSYTALQAGRLVRRWPRSTRMVKFQ